MPTYFCDTIKEVSILNGVARLEFLRLQSAGGGGPNRELQPVSEFIVALPVQGLLQALAVLEQVRDQLVRDGILKPALPEGAGGTPNPPAASPNFS